MAGRCIHQGMCCRFLSIHIESKRVDTMGDFHALVSKRPVMARFVPHGEGQRIDHFSCQCRKGGKCSEYDTRPLMCRGYPYSVFFLASALHVGCGYAIRMREIRYLLIPRWVRMSREFKEMECGARGV